MLTEACNLNLATKPMYLTLIFLALLRKGTSLYTYVCVQNPQNKPILLQLVVKN